MGSPSDIFFDRNSTKGARDERSAIQSSYCQRRNDICNNSSELYLSPGKTFAVFVGGCLSAPARWVLLKQINCINAIRDMSRVTLHSRLQPEDIYYGRRRVEFNKLSH